MSTDPVAATGGEGAASKDAGSSRIRTAASLVGRTLKGQYRLEKELGQGAHGVVFRGTQLALQKPVAIKMLRPDGFHGNDALDRFSREATVVSKLVHPSIAQVLDFGIEDDMPFLVMEFVDGKELTEVTESEGPLAPARAVAIIRQLASALDEAHGRGIVHRDIKPHNIRLMRYSPGGQIFVKVLDFGIAKQISDDGGGQKLTATGAVMGTPAYMAPEQAGGQPLTARADQYATGIVLYELLTGSVPFNSKTISGVIMAHLTQPPPELPPQVPESLRKIVMRLLAKDPVERFESCAALDRALADCESACRDVPALRRDQAPSTDGKPATLTLAAAATATPTPVETGAAGPSRKLILGGAFAAALCLIGGVAVFAPKRHKPADPATNPVTNPVTNPATNPATNPTGGPEAGPAANGNPAGTSPTKTGAGADKTDPVPPTAGTAKPTGKDGGETKPHAVTASNPGTKPAGKPAAEPPDVKEKLDRVEALLKAGTYDEAASIALKTTFSHPTPRAYRQLVTAYCNLGDLSHATTYFHRVAGGDKRALVSLCRKHDIDLN